MSSVQQHKVLVVIRSERADSAVAIQSRLRKSGYRLFEAGTVPEGWKMALNEQPDAIVVGVDLPTVFGWELVNRLRTDRRFDRMAVVVLPDEDNPEDEERARDNKAELVLPPWDPEEIDKAIAAALIEAQRSEMRGVRVLLLTDICEIEGTVHLPLELVRFSDGWEAIVGDNRSFVPVTDARVSTLDGKRLVATTSFMQITKSQVRGVLPLDAAIGQVAGLSLPADSEVPAETAALIGRLTRVAAGLARELAEERNVPVEQMLEEVVMKVGDEPHYHAPDAVKSP